VGGQHSVTSFAWSAWSRMGEDSGLDMTRCTHFALSCCVDR